MFIAFECFYSKSYGVLVKTIRKLACEEFLPTNYVKCKAQKHSKGFIFVYVFFSASDLQPVGRSYSVAVLQCNGPTV